MVCMNDDEKMADQGWPNSIETREELEAALESGLKSGVSDLTHEDIIAEARRELGLK